MKLVELDPRTLKPNPENYRGHPQEQIAEIATSLRDLGQFKNVVVRPDGTILAGHGVVQAAIAEGVPVWGFIFEGTDAEARRLMVADNELSRGAEDDERALHALLNEINRDFGDLAGTGWSDAEHEAVLKALAAEDFGLAKAEQEDPGAGEAPAEAQTRLGDVWLCGAKHRVVCGDCTEAHVWAALFGETRARMVWTDPPYGVDYGNHKNVKWGNHAPIANDALDEEGMKELWRDAATMAGTYADGDMYWAAPPGPLLRAMDVTLEDTPWERHQWLVWVKNSLVLGRSNYHYRHEQIWYGWLRGGTSSFCGDRTHDSVFEVDRPSRSEDHPTMKPVELVEQMVANSSKPGDIVADPFLGSGTTLIAAEKLGRVCYGIELEPRYVDVALRRWAQMTGEVPTLEADGTQFEVNAHALP